MADASHPESHGRERSRHVVPWLVLLVALVVLVLLGAAFIPRWWAHRIGDQANESMAGAITLGLFYGFVFTLLPLIVLAWAIRRRRSLKAWAFVLGAAAVLALPNLFTLGIVLGRGNAAHAGDRTLDVEAPGFRGATLAGALIALGVVGFGWHLLRTRRRARERERQLREELRARDESPAAESPAPQE